jgi:hypothetical protein
MQYRLIMLGVVLVSFVPVWAQEYPSIEFFVGGSVASTDVIGRNNAAGWQINTAFNPNQRLRLVGDFGGQPQNTNIKWQGQQITIRNYQVLFGPEFTLRRQRLTWFAHPLAGVAAAQFAARSGDVPATDYGFATEFGGGVDVTLSRLLALRVFQVDYILSQMHQENPSISALRPGDLPPLSDWQHSVRVGFGIVVRLAHREAQ